MKRQSVFNPVNVDPIIADDFARQRAGDGPDGTLDLRQGADYEFRHGHPGGQIDAATGYSHFRNRELDPAVMRWMPQDPFGYVEGLNEYPADLTPPATDSVDPEAG